MSALAMLYSVRIIEGRSKFSDVPKILKGQVKQILEEQGLGELAE